MSRRTQLLEDSGNAVIEFVLFGLLLQLPLLLLVSSSAEIQRNQLAAESIARQASRSFTLATSLDEAKIRLLATVQQVAQDFSLSPEELEVSFTCQPTIDCSAGPGVLDVKVWVGDSDAHLRSRFLTE